MGVPQHGRLCRTPFAKCVNEGNGWVTGFEYSPRKEKAMVVALLKRWEEPTDRLMKKWKEISPKKKKPRNSKPWRRHQECCRMGEPGRPGEEVCRYQDRPRRPPKHMWPVLEQASTPTTLQNSLASMNPFGSSAQQGLFHVDREPVSFYDSKHAADVCFGARQCRTNVAW